MRIRRINLCVLMLSFATMAVAQERLVPETDFALLQKARQYFSSRDFAVASDFASKWSAVAVEKDGQTVEEVEYMQAVSFAELNPADSKPVLTAFLEKYPKSIWNNRVMALTGVSCAMSGEYGEALNWFDSCEPERLDIADCRQETFCNALSLIKTGQTEKGYVMLSVLGNLGGYDEDVSFYKAYVDYHEGRYASATEGFSKSYGSQPYRDWASLYSAEMALRDGNATEALNTTSQLLDGDSDPDVQVEAERVLGEAYFVLGQWSEADEMLTSYISGIDNPARIDLYQLGMAAWEQGDYVRAQEYLGRVSDGGDELEQNSWLHRGLASLALGDTTSAVFAFERAASMNVSRELAEHSLYNYAMCVHEAGYSPFAEPVNAFERFLNEFPESSYRDRISERIVDVYLQSNNADAALASIDRLQNPDYRILAAKQRLLYSKGAELYASGRYQQSAEYMGKVADMGRYDRQLAANALFWRGETNFRQGRYTQALSDYNRYMDMTSDTGLYGLALYGAGYSFYRKSDWSQALSDWSLLAEKYSSGVSVKVMADAFSRMGDCYFYRHDYIKAEECYGKSVETYAGSGDYALFRTGLCQGLRKDYNGKISMMERLCEEYPLSAYCAPALYEEARAYQQVDKSADAIEVFSRLMTRYPESDLTRKASAETALIYYQNDDYDRAVQAYKLVIRNYPGSDEARTALRDLRSVYVETGRVDEYVEYMEQMSGFAPIAADEKDSLTFASAEILFTRGNQDGAEQAFDNYLTKYPTGKYSANANYYRGLIYIDRNDDRKALGCMSLVADNEHGKFYSSALENVAGLAYRLGEYRQSLDAYKRLYAMSRSAEQTRGSLIGIVRSAFAENDYGTVIEYADKAMDSRLDSNQETEVRYDKAVSLRAEKRNDEALEEFRVLSADTRTAYGAESSFIVSRMLYDAHDLDGAEKNIMDLISAGTSHSYWLARSFILLSDIYVAQDKRIEARQYLLSLKQNYRQDDDIAPMIEERLAVLE